MSFFELFVIAVGLSMDAFAASVCKGLASVKPSAVQCLIVGLYFGFFQALMPLTGYLIGTSFPASFTALDHWIAFILLSVIGFKTLLDSRNDSMATDDSFRPRSLLPLAIATSIDALSVGVSFAFLQTDIRTAVFLTGFITFLLSASGVHLGALFGDRFRPAAERAGGIVLILTGFKLLLEHMLTI